MGEAFYAGVKRIERSWPVKKKKIEDIRKGKKQKSVGNGMAAWLAKMQVFCFTSHRRKWRFGAIPIFISRRWGKPLVAGA